MDLARALGWLPSAQYINSPMAKPAALVGFHTPDYIAALQQAEAAQAVDDATRLRHNIGTHANPVFAQMYRRPATSAGAALLAGELLRDGGVIFAPGCGTHHGFPDYANGFCYLNDPVLAIQSLRRNGARRVAYVDIDAHHPDGVEHAFAADASVLMISAHEDNRWPRTGALAFAGAGQVFNMPLPRDCNDSEFALFCDQVLLPALAGFAPDAIVLQCGADAVAEDPQSRMKLSNNAHCDLLRALMALEVPRLLVTGGGGYNPWSVGRLWTSIWGVLNGHAIPQVLPTQASAVLRALAWSGQSRIKTPPTTWLTTLQDPARPGPIRDGVRKGCAALAARL